MDIVVCHLLFQIVKIVRECDALVSSSRLFPFFFVCIRARIMIESSYATKLVAVTDKIGVIKK
jgi:hypothetical protein